MLGRSQAAYHAQAPLRPERDRKKEIQIRSARARSPAVFLRCSAALVNRHLQVPGNVATAPPCPLEREIEKPDHVSVFKICKTPQRPAVGLGAAGHEFARVMSRRHPTPR